MYISHMNKQVNMEKIRDFKCVKPQESDAYECTAYVGIWVIRWTWLCHIFHRRYNRQFIRLILHRFIGKRHPCNVQDTLNSELQRLNTQNTNKEELFNNRTICRRIIAGRRFEIDSRIYVSTTIVIAGKNSPRYNVLRMVANQFFTIQLHI